MLSMLRTQKLLILAVYLLFPRSMVSLQLPRSQATKILFSGLLSINPVRAFVSNTGKDSSGKELTTMSASSSSNTLRVVFNGGDNMLGRAVQLSFPVQAPGEDDIWDSCPSSHYVQMCLHPSGHPDGDLSLDEIRKQNKEGNYLWKDYRQITMNPLPDLRILNFESHITRSIDNPDLPKWKGIRYHTHVDNIDAMIRPYAETTHGGVHASPVVVSLANNHVMDYGRIAFDEETMPALDNLHASIPSVSTVGSGRNWHEASKPTVIECEGKTPVEVFAFSSGCSGTPQVWWAEKGRSGVIGLPGLYDNGAIRQAVDITKRAFNEHPSSKDRLRILSLHLGPNWAMKGETEEEVACRREYAHRVIDECDVDMIYGHSSHHVRGMEVYKGKLILYGTGDIINDYEGFENSGEEKYNRLGGIYIADVDAATGNLIQLRIVPMFMNRLRLERYKKGSKMWRPNQRRLEVDDEKSRAMATFINKLSEIDAGGSEAALVMEHLDEDPTIPGGPVLISKHFSSGNTDESNA